MIESQQYAIFHGVDAADKIFASCLRDFAAKQIYFNCRYFQTKTSLESGRARSPSRPPVNADDRVSEEITETLKRYPALFEVLISRSMLARYGKKKASPFSMLLIQFWQSDRPITQFPPLRRWTHRSNERDWDGSTGSAWDLLPSAVPSPEC